MDTRKSLTAIIFAISFISLHAQNPVQKGVVRTALRPDREIVYLSDVSIRQRGGHNTVLSSSDGAFEMALPNISIGSAFYLSSVRKAGYELADNATIGKAFTYSPEVPIEIVMLDSRAKQEDIIRITNKAYARAEKEYAKKMASLEQQLQDKTLSEESYRQQLQELQTGFEKYESLISDMAERYASTDYATIDSLNAAINIAIENGDLEQADSLISTVGSLDRLVRESQEAMANARERQKIGTEIIEQASRDITDIKDNNKRLGDLLYSKYSIALTRFETDSAACYITLRAELDTTDVEWQIMAGIFMAEFKANYNLSLSLYQRALRNAKKLYDAHSDIFATIYNSIGWIYNSLGQFDTALEYYQKALGIWIYCFGTLNDKVATGYNNIGTIFDTQGKYEKALEYYSKALDIRLETLDTGHPDIAVTYINIGFLYSSLGNYDKALGYYRKALQIQTSSLEHNNPQIATTYNNIGSAYQGLGEFGTALDYYKKALEIDKTIYGETHPETAIREANIGTIYFQTGNFTEAACYFFKALNIFNSVYGMDHPDVATVLYYIGMICANQNEFEKALEYYQYVLKIRINTYGESHPEIAATYNNIGVLYGNKGDNAKALEYYTKALEIRKNFYGENHPTTAESYSNIGTNYYFLEDYDKAIDNHMKALDIYTRLFNINYDKIRMEYAFLYDIYLAAILKSPKYEKPYYTFMSDKIFTVTVISEDTPAAAHGMSGEYYLLEYEKWNHNRLDNLVDKNTELKGKPKDILVMKDGIISEHHFEDTIGAAIGLKYVGKEEKAAISEAYDNWKRQHRHESGK